MINGEPKMLAKYFENPADPTAPKPPDALLPELHDSIAQPKKNHIVNHPQMTNHFGNAIHCIKKCFITTHIVLITLFHHVPATVCYVLM